jgi:CubicO group peptidase (beta-lactamase class C family)
MTDFQTGVLELQTLSAAGAWTSLPAFPTGAAGLVSTADDYLAFSRLLLDKGVHQGERLLSEKSVLLMTTNHLTAEQMAGAGRPVTRLKTAARRGSPRSALRTDLGGP